MSRVLRASLVLFVVAALLPAAAALADVHGSCGDEFTPIYHIQGSGPASPLNRQTVVTEGVVTVDLQRNDQLRGFFLQDPEGDGNPATSDGIFVFHPGTSALSFDVAVGDHVRLRGTVQESFGQTQIGNLTHGDFCGTGTVAPTGLDARTFNANPESFEGMLVRFPRPLAVTDTFNLHRFGEVWLSELGVSEQPTNEFPPGPDAEELAEDNMARSILLDDGSRFTPDPIPYLREGGTLRLGDVVMGLTGAVGFGFSEYRLQPQSTGDVRFLVRNRRPAVPEVGGTVVVASANVLNYWTTLEDGRGASTPEQLEVQTDKLVAELRGLGADIIGLQEIENHPDHTPILALVDALNAAAQGAEQWAWVGPVDHYNVYPIRNEIIYRADRVTPVGGPVTIADDAFDRIPPGRSDPVGRPPVAQTFQAGGQVFTVMVNHFKSKGCDGAAGADNDQGDGQSCFNATRVEQAERVLAFVDELVEATGDPDVLVVADLNAYLEEDPVRTLEAGGLVNLVSRYDHDPYSFNFFARFAAPWIGRGLLDYALATPSLAKQVTRAAIWHINADEPRFLDWFDPSIIAPGPFRASDHDPVLVGLQPRGGWGR